MKKLQVNLPRNKRMNWLCGNKMQETAKMIWSSYSRYTAQVSSRSPMVASEETAVRAWVFRDGLPEPYFPKQPPRRSRRSPAQRPAAAAATRGGIHNRNAVSDSLRPGRSSHRRSRPRPRHRAHRRGGSGVLRGGKPRARRRRRSRDDLGEDGVHGTLKREHTEGFFGSVVGAATDDDALEPGMSSTSAGDDVDIGGGAGATGGSGSGSDGFSSGFPESRFQGLRTARGGVNPVAVIDGATSRCGVSGQTIATFRSVNRSTLSAAR